MPATKRTRRWGQTLREQDNASIGAACERLIVEVLKPRHLPEIRPTSINYPVDIVGRWRGSKYRFVTRYRSGFEHNEGEEFDAAFARLDHVATAAAELRFDLMWHRHTSQWFRLYAGVPLREALRLVETDPLLAPPL